MTANKAKSICILSGLPIPAGQKSKEHYVPRSRLPDAYKGDRNNIYYAIRIINNIKGNLLPCEWEENKYHILTTALTYHLTTTQKKLIHRAIDNMKHYTIDPCAYCILSTTAHCPER